MFLILRPDGKAQQTALAFSKAGLSANACSVIDINQDLKQEQALTSAINSIEYDAIIVTSTYAATTLLTVYSQADATRQTHIASIPIFCIGSSCKDVLSCVFKHTVVPGTQNSEGMLLLPSLAAQHLDGKRIAIIKGKNGRDLLNATLRQRGAATTEFDVYTRNVMQTPNFSKVFVEKEIKCIIATSSEVIDAGLDLLEAKWLLSKPWIVVSDRIKQYLHQLGAKHIVVAKGASHQALIKSAMEFKES